jgi:Protein of unknown function (DUF1553)/Protein of unknown function (DUF1549)/Planctomycete cytochrome C
MTELFSPIFVCRTIIASHKRRMLGLTVIACTFLLVNVPIVAEDAKAKIPDEQVRYFEAHVRPLLAEKCWSCHGEKEAKGGLRLDSKNAILNGGESGAAAVEHKAAESMIIEAVRYESLEMPPDEKLSKEQIEILVRWVELGMPWPGSEDSPAVRASKDRFTEEDRAWWAIQPLKKPSVPDVESSLDKDTTFKADKSAWQGNPIDAFIYQSMAASKLTPAGEADRISLIRRLYYDLIGIPPTITQVQSFVKDPSPDAYEAIVDELLGSPRYGERWARHWLDHYRPNAWRYRDYVIDSFNNDKPYDRFVQEQLAGDELFPNDLEAQIATGFMRHWIYEYNNRDVKTQWQTILNDITDTTSDVFLGLGLQCAKCHDHKFDPLLQRDYFRLQAFFAPVISTQTVVSSQREQEAFARQLAEWESETVELRQQIQEIEKKLIEDGTKDGISKFPPDIQAILRKEEADQAPYEKQLYEIAYRQIIYEHERIDTKVKGDNKEKLISLRKELAVKSNQKPKPLKVAMTVTDVGVTAPDVLIPKRAKKPVLPGFPTLIDSRDAVISPVDNLATTGRRSALARWLTQPDNPLSSRVMVNRVWQFHFGRGLAANASDFGKLGGKPTHPELLDWLATSFVDEGWSLKKLHRRIVTSATYRQSSKHSRFTDFQTIDPSNQFYWRGDTRRLDAEQIRDSILIAAGLLRHADLVSIPLENRQGNIEHRIEGGEGVLPDVPRRSIYTRVMRNARDPLLDVFDLPQFFSSESSRNTTTTPVQALLLFNSSEMLRYAGLMTESIWKEYSMSLDRITAAFQLTYSRSPTNAELSACHDFLARQESRLREHDDANMLARRPQRQLGKIPYRDGQAVYVSQDETTPPLIVRTANKISHKPWSVETYFQIRSVREDATVRTLVSKWSGKSKEPGWSFGITGKGSRRKPQTLVVVLWGKRQDGTLGEAAVFSDQLVELNKPYFGAAAIEPATETSPGHVTFYLKDLSNDDDPLQVARVEHNMMTDLENDVPITIGGCGAKSLAVFDGLIDDIRISKTLVPESRLLLTSEIVTNDTVGFWRFEAEPGIMHDSSGFASHLTDELADVDREKKDKLDSKSKGDSKAIEHPPEYTAFIDLCHAMLNSNEFLYVD